jgi:hypothetical protein
MSKFATKGFIESGHEQLMQSTKQIQSIKLLLAAWILDMFCNFYFVNNHEIANKLITSEAREKINTYLKSLELQIFFDVCLT